MKHKAKSIRPFIGAKNFEVSRNFYRDLGFEESVIDASMSLFTTGLFGFYLQNAFVKDWVDNTMLFLEVEDVDQHWKDVSGFNLPAKYDGARLSPIHTFAWGREYYLHDPSGILWHIGAFLR